MKEFDICDSCEYAYKCEDMYRTCEGCKDYDDCPLKSVFCMCKKGYYLQCNNGYETEDEYELEDE